MAPKQASSLGARSAVLLPLPKLGLIVVDEEHEPSFATRPRPRYHARDVALWLAAKNKVPTVLGSATPAVETQLVDQGRLNRVSLTERFGGAMLPEIFVADLKKEHKQRSMRGGSASCSRRDGCGVGRGQAGHLFQNRRGYAPSMQCTQCGRPRASVATSPWWCTKPGRVALSPLRYHERPAPTTCIACGSAAQATGVGHRAHRGRTPRAVPGTRGARLGHHTEKDGPRQAVGGLCRPGVRHLGGDPDGVQRPRLRNVGLVGVLSADRMLTFPDFRSFERAYQMLTRCQAAQAAPRRTSRQGGHSVVQRRPLVVATRRGQDHEALVKRELIERQTYMYPPLCGWSA